MTIIKLVKKHNNIPLHRVEFMHAQVWLYLPRGPKNQRDKSGPVPELDDWMDGWMDGWMRHLCSAFLCTVHPKRFTIISGGHHHQCTASTAKVTRYQYAHQ